MFKVELLSSGSHGNSAVLSNGETTIGIDFGVKSFKLWDALAKSRGIKVEDIDHLFITHSHGDHIASLNTYISKNGNETVYTTNKVISDISKIKKLTRFDAEKVNALEINEWHIVGTFKVRPVKMKHYGANRSAISECVGYEIYDSVNDKYILYASDTSSLENVNIPEKGFDLVMVESNYDEQYEKLWYEMVQHTPKNNMLHTRTVYDHMSTQQLDLWLISNGINCDVIELHESKSKKPQKKWFSTNELGSFNRIYWEEKEGQDE